MTIKELSLYKIRDLALKSGKMVYDTIQLANLNNKDQAVSAVYLNGSVK